MTHNNSSFEEQSLYLSGVYIDGVQSIASNIDFPSEDYLSLGYTTPVASAIDGVLEGEFSANRVLISEEDILTGCFPQGVSGHLRYTPESSYIFETGLITDYSCRAEINEIPELDFTLQTWGKMFTSITGYGEQPGSETNHDYDTFLPNPGDITMEVTDCAGGHELNLTSNGVRSFDYNIRVEWNEVSTLGSSSVPQGFYVSYPIEVEAIVTVEVNTFIEPNFLKKICQPIYKKLTLNINKCDPDCGDSPQVLRKFVVPNGQLLSYSNFSDMDDVLLVELVFVSKITSIYGLGALVGK